MKKRRGKQILRGLLCLSAFCFLLSGPAVRAEEGGERKEELVLSGVKIWEDKENAERKRPAEITLSLYKYVGTLDTGNTQPIQTLRVTEGMNWEYSFPISQEQLKDENGAVYQFAVREAPAAGYREKEEVRVDPHVAEFPWSVNDFWKRFEPCNELDLVTSGAVQSVVVVKKGNNYTVWTSDALSAAEQHQIYVSATAGVDGMNGGKEENFVYVNGLGTSYKGMTFQDGKVTFENHKDWSFFGVGLYRKATVETFPGLLTNVLLTVEEPEEENPTKPPVKPSPGNSSGPGGSQGSGEQQGPGSSPAQPIKLTQPPQTGDAFLARLWLPVFFLTGALALFLRRGFSRTVSEKVSGRDRA